MINIAVRARTRSGRDNRGGSGRLSIRVVAASAFSAAVRTLGTGATRQ
jgi:hypothetical protein